MMNIIAKTMTKEAGPILVFTIGLIAVELQESVILRIALTIKMVTTHVILFGINVRKQEQNMIIVTTHIPIAEASIYQTPILNIII